VWGSARSPGSDSQIAWACRASRRRVVEQAVELLAQDDPELVKAHGNWGTLLLQQGRPLDAVVRYEEALAAAERNLGPDHPDVATWLLGLGSASMTLGDLERAETFLRRSLRIHLDTVGEGAIDVVAGTTHTCARRATGQVVCWGDGTRGQLGAGIQGFWTTRVPVKGLTTVTDLSVGSDLTCARLTTGDLRCWGTAGTGFFPTGTKFDTPIAVRTPRGMRQIALGATHACALRTDGKVECWGDDTFGQLGEGVLAYAEVPTPVKGLYSAS
jgi:hypothetical protein